ncbi:MAG TPA: hypothetical protein VLR49_06945 [Ferruginibacter sp.]|nr:hypothetical protein [Ferruginibacter sp.]
MKLVVINTLKKYQATKSGKTATLTLSQLQSKSDSLKQMLGFMMDENSSLKYRLSEVLKEKFDKNMLVEAENYQSYFIKEDELIGLLRNDIAMLDKGLKRMENETEVDIRVMDKKLKSIHKHITTAGNQFCKLRLNFIKYLKNNSLVW